MPERRSRSRPMALGGHVARATAGVSALSLMLVGGALPARADWGDQEWVRSGLSTLDCTSDVDNRAGGRMLAGSLLGLDLDPIAEVSGVVVQREAGAAAATPASATQVVPGVAWRDPLQVGVLSALQVDLTQVLHLPVSTDVGVLGQFGRVTTTGVATGAAGLVDDAGGVQLTAANSGSAPAFATLDLRTLLGGSVPALSGIADLAGLELEIGALASAATLDGCAAAWTGAAGLEREYAIAGLDLGIETPLVGALTTSASGVINGLQGTVNSLMGSAGVTTQLTTRIGTLLSGTLGTLSLGTVVLTGPTVTVDTAPAVALLTERFHDPDELVTIDLAAGTVEVDLAALLGSEYGGIADTLNGLDPNTQLLIDGPVLNRLTAAVSTALDAWTQRLLTKLTQIVLDARVQLTAVITLRGLGSNIATVTATIDDSLARVIAGQATVGVSTSIALLTALCPDPSAPLAGLNIFCALHAIVGGVLSNVTTALVNGLGGALGSILDAALFTVDTAPDPDVRTLRISLTPVTIAAAPIVTLVGTVTSVLFGEHGVLSVLVNAQNAPSPSNANPLPGWSVPTGRYDVAALRIVAVGLLSLLSLDLARSSVGASTASG